MDKQLAKNAIQIFVPVVKIEKLIGTKLNYTVLSTQNLRQEDPSAYNMAIERSLFSYYPEPFDTFPKDLGYFRKEVVFSKFVDRFLKFASEKMGRTFQLPPKEQIYFEGAKGEVTCFLLHLANTLNNELFISDIVLQNPKNPNIREHTFDGYKGLGYGIFNEILLNIEDYARRKKYARIGLLASNKINMEIFSRRGFVIEESIIGERAMQSEQGYPMVKFL